MRSDTAVRLEASTASLAAASASPDASVPARPIVDSQSVHLSQSAMPAPGPVDLMLPETASEVAPESEERPPAVAVAPADSVRSALSPDPPVATGKRMIRNIQPVAIEAETQHLSLAGPVESRASGLPPLR